MHSSQNEQDSRFYGKFALIPILEPSSQQEAYDMMEEAFRLSEEMKLPVLMRIVTRLAHSRAAVAVKEEFSEVTTTGRPSAATDWVLLPAIARRRYLEVIAEQPQLEKLAETSPYNLFSPAREAGPRKERHNRLRHRIQLRDGELSRRLSLPLVETFTIPASQRENRHARRAMRRDSRGWRTGNHLSKNNS